MKRVIFLSFILFFIPAFIFPKSFFWKLYKNVKINDDIAVLNSKYVEYKASYEQYFAPNIIKLANECYKRNRKILKKEEKTFGVDKRVITSILMIESKCGRYKEKYNIVEVYKTLIYLAKNKNYQRKIFKIVKKKFPDTSYSYFKKRIKIKQNWAKAQLKALQKIYDFYGIDVFKVRGSWAGAFGLPQFLPTTFLNFAVDGNKDGKIDLDNFYDAIFSIGNYLKRVGWKNHLAYNKKLKVIMKYNHSLLYAKTILKLAGMINEK